MKRFFSVLLAFYMVFNNISGRVIKVHAASQEEIDAAQQRVNDLQDQVNEGILGFYRQNGTYDEIFAMINEGNVLAGQQITQIGNPADATSIDNVLTALDLIAEGNTLRAGDEHRLANHDGNDDALKVTDYMMALAQIQTNYIAVINFNHWHGLKESRYFYYTGENIAWGSYPEYDPFSGWYTKEKADYEAGDLSEAGHYLNLVNPDAEDSTRKSEITGFGASQYTGALPYDEGYSYAQEFARTDYPTGLSYDSNIISSWGTEYTVAEYKAAVISYRDNLNTQLAQAQAYLEELQNTTEETWTVRYVLSDGQTWEGEAPQTEYTYTMNETHTVISNRVLLNEFGREFGGWIARKVSDPDNCMEFHAGHVIPFGEYFTVNSGDIVILTPTSYKSLYGLTFHANADDAYLATDEGYKQENTQWFPLAEEAIYIYQEVVRENYTLAGWSKTPDGSVDYYNGSYDIEDELFLDGDVDLYAVWEPEQQPQEGVSITYVLDDGASMDVDGVIYTGSYVTTYNFEDGYLDTISSIPVKEGYQFYRWQVTANGVVQSYLFGNVDCNMLYDENGDPIEGPDVAIVCTPVWNKVYSFSVTYYLNMEGATYDEIEYLSFLKDYNTDQSSFSFPRPYKEGAAYKGWAFTDDATEPLTNAELFEVLENGESEIDLYAVWGEMTTYQVIFRV
ncbi:MAG: InlB B-repeat-containing protein, partial [Solobacterium sp.]|nr:InlB B-repeat-containing protein [Solobacterium sp.]